MANAQGQLVFTLNYLIEVGKDGELTCMTGAREVYDAEMRSILTGTAETCRNSVTELRPWSAPWARCRVTVAPWPARCIAAGWR